MLRVPGPVTWEGGAICYRLALWTRFSSTGPLAAAAATSSASATRRGNLYGGIRAHPAAFEGRPTFSLVRIFERTEEAYHLPPLLAGVFERWRD